ncbi:MAG: PEPxxWA-CTERM sorting domain-containing protein [Proteobacteria bacterium]|nr:PEPxxWA-CTERM sorting domain-containing protein [Pseudomonadota bacterium]
MSPLGFSAVLGTRTTYYLHVVANNFGGPGDNAGNPDAFLAGINVYDDHGDVVQTLNTDTTDWRASPNGVEQDLSGPISWTAPTGAPIDLGVNGSAIWGNAVGGPMDGISTSAHWIWSATDPSGEAFFSATIAPIGGAVPEPSEWALMIMGFGLAGAALRRRRSVAAAA